MLIVILIYSGLARRFEREQRPFYCGSRGSTMSFWFAGHSSGGNPAPGIPAIIDMQPGMI
jgi:hypothetical protein